MNVFKEQSGLTVIIVVLVLIGLLGVSEIGYQVNRSKHRANIQPPASIPTTPTGIDYPVSQGIKGKVFCNEKVDPKPCTTKIEIKPAPSNPPTGSYGPAKTLETDVQGNFSIELVSGAYTITPTPKEEFPMFVPQLPNPVTVKDRQMTEITITYHSGLR